MTILIASTIYEIFMNAKKRELKMISHMTDIINIKYLNIYVHFHISEQPKTLLVAFSIYTNGKKLFQIESSQDSTSFLTCLSGLRSLAMMFILLGHTFETLQAIPRLNANTMKIDGEWFQSYVNAFVGVHPIAVDSFFVIGGLLLTRSMLCQIEKYLIFLNDESDL